MTSQFANGASTIRNVLFEASADGLRWDNGFPDDPYAKKISEGGKHVLIGDMNGMSKAASAGLFIRQNGGTNEFSETVILVDKGFKSDNDHWGYPRGAIIDWWKAQGNSGTLRKVMCVKNGQGTNEGNCKASPDDPVHGVEGSGEIWWIDITYSPRSYRIVEASNIGEVASYDSISKTYTATKSCIITFGLGIELVNNYGHSQGNISDTDTIELPVPMTKGDIFYYRPANGITIYIKHAGGSAFMSTYVNPYEFGKWGSTEVRFRSAYIVRAQKYVMN